MIIMAVQLTITVPKQSGALLVKQNVGPYLMQSLREKLELYECNLTVVALSTIA